MIGITPQSREHVEQLRDRTLRDARFDAGAQREEHWSGPMVHPTTYVVDKGGIIRWVFQSKMAQRRPSPVRLAAIAGAVAKGATVPAYVEE